MITLSKRVNAISGSPTLKMTQIKSQMKAQGRTVIDFGVGEPDFNTPEPIKQAGIAAISGNFTRYTPNTGIPDLKAAIRTSYAAEQGVEPAENEIIVSAGSKFSAFVLMQAVLDPGDEVILPKPYWVSYPEMAIFCGATPVYADHLKTMPMFAMTAASYIEKWTPKTKLVLINSPSNPTGMIMPEAELVAAIRFFAEKNVLVVIDDCYRSILFTGGDYPSPLKLLPEFRDRIAIVASLSKTYAMTGWRLGYTIAPAPLVAAMGKIQEHSTSNACSISQKAAVAALLGDKGAVQEMVRQYAKRRELVARKMDEIGHVRYVKPDGAFYFFADFTHWVQALKFKSDTEMAMAILDQTGVIMVAGSGFGAPGYLRLSFAASEQDLENGLNLVKNYLHQHAG
jgi:aspartate aminotransferase